MPAMTEVAGGESWLGTLNVATHQPADSDALGRQPSDPRPWFIDQGWAMARIDGLRPDWPRGATLSSAYQHLGGAYSVDSSSNGLPARMNSRLIPISKVGHSPTGPRCGDPADRLSPVRSAHTGGSQFLMGDGTVRFISDGVDKKVYARLFTIRGGELLDEDDF